MSQMSNLQVSSLIARGYCCRRREWERNSSRHKHQQGCMKRSHGLASSKGVDFQFQNWDSRLVA